MTLDLLAPFGGLGPSKGVASHAALGLAANMAPALVELGYRINPRCLVYNPWLLATLPSRLWRPALWKSNRLLMLVNDWSLCPLIPNELAKGFGPVCRNRSAWYAAAGLSECSSHGYAYPQGTDQSGFLAPQRPGAPPPAASPVQSMGGAEQR